MTIDDADAVEGRQRGSRGEIGMTDPSQSVRIPPQLSRGPPGGGWSLWRRARGCGYTQSGISLLQMSWEMYVDYPGRQVVTMKMARNKHWMSSLDLHIFSFFFAFHFIDDLQPWLVLDLAEIQATKGADQEEEDAAGAIPFPFCAEHAIYWRL